MNKKQIDVLQELIIQQISQLNKQNLQSLMQNNLNQPFINNQYTQNQPNPYSPQNYALPPESDIRQSQSYAADVNKLQDKKTSYHIKSLIATFFLWIGVPVIVSLALTKTINVSGGGLAGICVGFYLFYLLLAMCCNPLFSYLSHIQHGARFREEYLRIQGINGHFVFNVECYHYETRYHTRTVSDGNGGTRTQTYTTTQKVVTYRNSENLYPAYTKDDSGSVDDVRAMTLVVFIHYLVNYRFFDAMSRQNFDHAWYTFKRFNTRDVHQDFTYAYTVPGLVERMTFFIGQKKPNWKGFLIFWSLIGLIWPFSMYVQTKTSRYNIEFLKILTIGRYGKY